MNTSFSSLDFAGIRMKTNCAVKLGQLQRTDLRPAALILGRAMRDNPMHVRAFAISDAERRSRALERFFLRVLLGLHQRGLIYGAYLDNELVGVCGIARPGFCQPAPLEKLRVLPAVVFGNPPGTALRVLNWTDAWAHRDPAEPHWHLGPVAIEPSVQRQGIGSALLTAFCGHIDADGATAYLETDRQANVHFYQKFGFAVVAEAEVMGVPNWFMSRPAVFHPNGDPRKGSRAQTPQSHGLPDSQNPSPIVQGALIQPHLNVPGQ